MVRVGLAIDTAVHTAGIKVLVALVTAFRVGAGWTSMGDRRTGVAAFAAVLEAGFEVGTIKTTQRAASGAGVAADSTLTTGVGAGGRRALGTAAATIVDVFGDVGFAAIGAVLVTVHVALGALVGT